MAPEIGRACNSPARGVKAKDVTVSKPEDEGIKSRETDETVEEQQLWRDLETKRRQIGLARRPLSTLRYFSKSAGAWIRASMRMSARHPLFASVIVPGALTWALLERLPGPHTDAIDQFEHVLKFVIWWVGLGILSSVGVGCGINSGILFLFPHLTKICLAIEACGSVNFNSSENMWFSSAEDSFACPTESGFMGLGEGVGGGDGGRDDDGGRTSPVTYFQTLLKVYPACFLWGLGTAIGEIPPYALSRAAAKAGAELEDGDELRDLEQQRRNSSEVLSLVTRAKLWMIAFLQQQGFVGVFFLSAVPNMAFDVCGMFCGHFGMPFWQFFGGVLLGKAGVRVLIQASLFVMLFHRDHLESFIALVRRTTPASWNLGGVLHTILVEGRAKYHGNTGITRKGASDLSGAGGNSSSSGSSSEGGGFFKSIGLGAGLKAFWTVWTVVLLALFLVTTIDQIARRSAQEEHEEVVRLFREKRRRSRGHVRPRLDAQGKSDGDKLGPSVDLAAKENNRAEFAGDSRQSAINSNSADGLAISSPSACLGTHKVIVLSSSVLESAHGLDAQQDGDDGDAVVTTPTKTVLAIEHERNGISRSNNISVPGIQIREPLEAFSDVALPER